MVSIRAKLGHRASVETWGIRNVFTCAFCRDRRVAFAGNRGPRVGDGVRGHGDEDGKGRDSVLEGIPGWPATKPGNRPDYDIHRPDSASRPAPCAHHQPRLELIAYPADSIQHLRIFEATPGLF
jgi:hypothetical protein